MATDQQTSAPEVKLKGARQRSVSYPSYPLSACIELVKKIDAHFSDVMFSTRESISKELKLSGGALLMNLSSCVQYGLLQLKQNEGYKPSAIFKSIKRPLPEEKLTDIYLKCFNAPELYKKLISDFNGKQLPQEGGLANILDRKYGVIGNAANVAARTFIRNVEFIGLLGEANVLELESQPQTEEPLDSTDITLPREGKVVEQDAQPPQLSLPPSTTNFATVEIPVFLDGAKRKASVLVPADFSTDEIAKIIKVLNGYLP